MAKLSVATKVFGLTAVEIYKLVLKRDIKKFPKGFWQLPEAPENAITVTRYMFENILSWNDDDFIKKHSGKIYIDNKLYGMLTIVYENTPFKALDAAYPGRFKEWELASTPMGFWNNDTMIQATKWLIEEKLKWNRDDIKKNLKAQVFGDNGLRTVLFKVNGVFEALDLAYPKEYLPWELSSVTREFWNKNTAISATKWLLNERLQWNNKDIINKLTKQVFIDNGLEGMLDVVYESSPFSALDDAYPDKYKPWELNVVSRNYWNEERAIVAIKWMVEEKLRLNPETDILNIKIETFQKYGLSAPMQKYYSQNPKKAIRAAYPDRFKEEN